MVKLFLVATKGNSGGRYFPYSGYLGLTPLRVEGLVRTKIEEDGKPIPAKSLYVSIRCYEHRQGKTGALHSRVLVDYSKVLWKKPDDTDFADIGDFDSTFKITLPKRVAGFSTAHYKDYRVYWRIEAVLDHVPLVGVGTRLFRCYDLPLIRYDIPPPLPSPPLPTPNTQMPSSTPHTLYHPTKSQSPILRYNLSTPVLPIGPSDYVFTSLHLRPLNPSISIRSATVVVERRIDLHKLTSASQTFTIHSSELPPDDLEPPSPSPSRPRSSRASAPSSPPIAVSSSMPESSSAQRRSPYTYANTFSSSTVDTTSATPSASQYTVTTPLLPSAHNDRHAASTHSHSPGCPSDAPSRSLTSIIAYADSGMGGFAVDRESGIWSKTVSLQWPKPRGYHYWAQGETSKSDLADVTFWVRVKIIISSPSTGTESFDLEPQEITIVSTNDSDRRLALAKFAEQKDLAAQRERSKSKSPGRRHTRSAHGRTGTETASGTDSETPHVPSSDDDRKSSSSQSQKSKRSSSVMAIPIPPIPPSLPPPVPPRTPTKPRTPTTPSHKSSHAHLHSTHHHHQHAGTAAPPMPPPPPPQASLSLFETLSSSGKKLSLKAKTRRPHTSAGPRDKSNLPYSITIGGKPDPTGQITRPGTGHGHTVPLTHSHQETSATTKGTVFGITRGVDLSVSGSGKGKEELVKDWEEELVKIENRSRRSSASMLAFFGWRRKHKSKEVAA